MTMIELDLTTEEVQAFYGLLDGRNQAVLDGLKMTPEEFRQSVRDTPMLVRLKRKFDRALPVNAVQTLYRLFDRDGNLLYVGISHRGRRRMGEHALTKHWWGEVASATFDHFSNRSEVALAEALAIQEEKPRYNAVQPRIDSLRAMVATEQADAQD